MSNNVFDYKKADSQGTAVEPIQVKDFDFDAYVDYEAALSERLLDFWAGEDGVAVYRRFRVPEVYSWASQDHRLSLQLQLAALQKSMRFKADIPNFLEPWYGIGVVSSAFGIPYIWESRQAPAVNPPYTTAKEAKENLKTSVSESPIGKKVFEMIDYFLEKTKGKIPLSLSDTQSPMNIVSSYILNTSSFMFETFDHPDELASLISLVSELEFEFISHQARLIGDALALPGHGFASSKCFSGIGFSDDNILMISDETYRKFALDPLCRVAKAIGKPVFHSCGNWSGRADLITSIPELLMADGAVGGQTDPDPNVPEKLGEAFADSGIILHVRIVGSPEVIRRELERIWRPGLKLIVATYCETEEEQQEAYQNIHSICS
ncbi:MAG: uroporphyrinogen decarboxylase family protein [Spirochaetia bacterium]|nr:uroporphyrinogen decarboxylase family protein [Spirochaetia bacterium]